MNGDSWHGYVRGILASLAVLALSQLWFQKEKCDNLQDALFDIKSEVSRNRELLRAAREEIKEHPALSNEDQQGFSDNLNTEALQRHRILLAAEDPKYTDILIAYDADIAALKGREDKWRVFRRKVEQEAKAHEDDIATRERHRDFLIVNRDKLTNFPDLLKNAQDEVVRRDRIYRLIEKQEEIVASEFQKGIVLYIDMVLVRDTMANSVMNVITAQINLRKTLLWIAVAAVVIVLLAYGLLPARQKTKSPTNEHSQAKGQADSQKQNGPPSMGVLSGPSGGVS